MSTEAIDNTDASALLAQLMNRMHSQSVTQTESTDRVSEASGNNAAGTDFANKIFAQLDTNGDGMISNEEAQVGIQQSRNLLGSLDNQQSRMAQYSANTAGTASAPDAKAFNTIDTDGNGTISETEFAAYQLQQAQFNQQGESASGGNPLSAIMGDNGFNRFFDLLKNMPVG